MTQQVMNKQKLREDIFTRTESFIVVLDSRNATDYNNGSSNSSLIFQLDDSIRKPHNSFLMTYSVFTFTCPISFYQLNATNNALSILLNGTTTTYSFPYGNYNVNTFIAQFQALLPSSFTLTFNTINNVFTITNSLNNFSILGSSTIGSVMGFVKGKSFISSSNAITLPYTVNFGGINSFNILCRNILTKNINSYSACVSSIIASVPINNAQNNTIYYEKKVNMDFIFPYETLDYIQIDIQDDLGNFIDFNNQNWNLVLVFNNYEDVEKSTKDNFYDITGFVLDTPNLT